MHLNHTIHTAQDCCGLVGRFEGQHELAPILCQACVLSLDGIREQDSVLLAAEASVPAADATASPGDSRSSLGTGQAS